MQTTATWDDQTRVTLPTARLLAAMLGAGAVAGGGWALAVWALGRGPAEMLAGPVAVAIVAVCTGGGCCS